MKHLLLSLIVVFFASGWFGKSQKENSNAEETIERLVSQLLEFKHQKTKYSDQNFLRGQTNDIYLHYSKSNPERDASNLADILQSNLTTGSWIKEYTDRSSNPTGSKILNILVKEGYEYISLKFKKYDPEKFRLFNEYQFTEVIEIRLRISHNGFNWIELEVVRLF